RPGTGRRRRPQPPELTAPGPDAPATTPRRNRTMNTRTVAGLGIAVVAAAAGGWLWMDYSIRKAVDNYLQSAVDSGRYDALSYEDLHFNLRRDITLENFLVREDDLVYVFD